MKDQDVWFVQVKGVTYGGDWWFQYGYSKEEHIHNRDAKMFNRAKGPFRANVVALVCVRSPFEINAFFCQLIGQKKLRRSTSTMRTGQKR